VRLGRLLHLVGENNPACCGFLKYKLDALAYIAPYADFNLDGTPTPRSSRATLMATATSTATISWLGSAKSGRPRR
jgi:hypothetical protein